MTSAADELREALVESQALPVLFVGSGLSRRYLGSPDWDGLLEHFASLTPRSIAYYRGLAGSDRPKIASLIAEEFYRVWFADYAYKESRLAYEAEVQDVADPLKYEIAQYVANLDVAAGDVAERELEALSRIHANAVITTNWDTLLEDRLPELEVFVGQQDVLFATTQAVGEIYKIHGSATDPKSIVVTSDDYDRYWDGNPYLIAKLLTMLVEHPVLFLGYSLSDAHINRMLANLITCLTSEQIEVLNDRLVFVRRAPDTATASVLQRGSITVGEHTLSIREFVCADFGELFTMLGDLPERFPAKLLRRLRQSVYELTFSTEPSGRVHVLPIEDGENPDDVEIVVGVGTMERLGEKGYSSIGRAELCTDMLNAETDHNATRLLDGLLPRLLRGAKYVPVFYPLYLAGRTDASGAVVETSGLPANGKALISGTTKLAPYTIRDLAKRRSQHFRDLLTEDPKIALEYGLVCQYDLEDVVALRDFLLRRVPAGDPVNTSVAKLCCRYDHLVFGPGFSGDRAALHSALGVSRTRRRRRAGRPA
ncbi:SIR2 family protein [Cellulomonas iranensis]|uniref:SIR2 family protein n=1 Tax=Cellulomonas iranensis TaxID=76862 RepID=UPI003D7E4A9B